MKANKPLLSKKQALEQIRKDLPITKQINDCRASNKELKLSGQGDEE